MRNWVDVPSDAVLVQPMSDAYCALAVDGSQIYPDRHQGIGCFLLNMGVVQLHYGEDGYALFDSVPYVFGGDYRIHGRLDVFPETVNALRCEYEMVAGLKRMQELRANGHDEQKQMLLLDGALIFWNLEASDGLLREVRPPDRGR